MGLAVGQHWLYDWIDEFEVTETSDLHAIIKYPGAVSRLYELATASLANRFDAGPLNGAVVAGSGMDIRSGMCDAFTCRNRIVDRNFGQLLHYFDYFVMEGPLASAYANLFKTTRDKKWLDRLLLLLRNDVPFLLHLRTIGLDKYVVFAGKRALTATEFHARLTASGLGNLWEPEELECLAREISRDGGVEVRQAGPRTWKVALRHPLFSGMPGHIYERKTRPKKVEAAIDIITSFVRAKIIDGATSELYKAALADLLHAEFFEQPQESGSKAQVDQVALSLNIPVLDRLKTRDIITLRESEHEHFERFRAVLVEAIAETIDKHENVPPEEIAGLVWRNTIEPSVAEIEAKLKASKRSLALKAAAGLTVGAATAAFGTLAALPFVVTAGIAAASTPLLQAYKFFDDKQAIEVSEMYFLWKAGRHSHG
ncbi:hypothetical protein LAH08_06365 [Micromonospora noduli]|uniref:Uncharacterized protein n=1 Tax=Micromonospora noduli TaxID=709876 RepID=A0A328MZV5_9ACTN|nr:hypothetical protein LAH08_06365 [Micromonospora noduli]